MDMIQHHIVQKYKCGSLVSFNGSGYRVNAFKYEVRPMGIFKIYEITPINGGNKVETAEHILQPLSELN